MSTESPIYTAERITDISVVVPVYRSTGTLVDLHRRLEAALSAISTAYQIVYVDDASPGDDWAMLRNLHASDPERVTIVQLMRNRGQQRAVLTGMAHARGELVVTMDADLQQRPEDIARLHAAIISEPVDAVVGRYPAKQHGKLRRLGTWLVQQYYVRNFGVERELQLTSFRILRKPVVEQMLRLRHQNPVVGYLMLLVTRRVINVDVAHQARAEGQSTYNLKGLIDYFSVMILDYSDWPLRLVGMLGLFSAAASFATGLWFLAKYLFGGIGVSGFTTVVLLLTFLFGLVFMSLGVIGAYLVRILRHASLPAEAPVRHLDGHGDSQ